MKSRNHPSPKPPAASEETLVPRSRAEPAKADLTAQADPPPGKPPRAKSRHQPDATVLDDAAPAPAQAQLLLLGSKGQVIRQLPLEADGEIKIGRANSCDMRLRDPSASRLHAAIVGREGNHTLISIAARQRNQINGKPADTEHALEDEDRIQLATEVLVYRRAAARPG